MRSNKASFLMLVSAGLFLTFTSNVLLGAAGHKGFLSDVGELLVLFLSCVAFVATTLQLEKNATGTEPSKRQSMD